MHDRATEGDADLLEVSEMANSRKNRDAEETPYSANNTIEERMERTARFAGRAQDQ